MGMATGGGGGLQSDINVTPLVDVVLVLLIIFMVVTPLTQRGYDIDIPKESNVVIPDDTRKKQVILAINETDCRSAMNPLPQGSDLPPDCRVRLNQDVLTLAELPVKTSDIFKGRKREEKILFLAAQEKLNYEAVVRILDIAKAGDEELKVGIVTDEKLATTPEAAAATGM